VGSGQRATAAARAAAAGRSQSQPTKPIAGREVREPTALQRCESCESYRDFGCDIAHAAVAQRPPNSLFRIVARTHMYTYDAKVWDVPSSKDHFLLHRANPNILRFVCRQEPWVALEVAVCMARLGGALTCPVWRCRPPRPPDPQLPPRPRRPPPHAPRPPARAPRPPPLATQQPN
jgi:hypothetical protein